MVETISGAERPRNRQLFERLFRLRYHVFVKQRQWSLPAHNGLESDEYDCPAAVYFFEQDADGAIISHLRMTPTRTHSLLADKFAHLVESDTDPRGDTIWEATRYVVRPATRSRAGNRASRSRLVVHMLEWCRTQGITHIQAVVDTCTLATYIDMTPETRPLGLSHPYGGGPDAPGGGECVAWRWPVTDKVIADVRRYGETVTAGCETCDLEAPAAAF